MPRHRLPRAEEEYMKPNYAGALTFVIWYFLIAPPVEHGLTDAVDENLPLARWTTE
jgi:hypothetical protein